MAALDSRYPRFSQRDSSVEPASSPSSDAGSDPQGVDSTITSDSGEGPLRRRHCATPQQWGHFAQLERIGRGVFGEVYRAWDAQLERAVALKLCRTDDRCQESSIRRGLREARLIARVQHPNVVTVYGADCREGRFGVWMEYIRGRTLEALVRAKGCMAVGDAARIGLDLCAAVAAVHRSGLLHGDIKTRNVMRERGGRIVLMDFGLSQEIRTDNLPDSRSLEVCGTPVYMAPELLWGAKPTVRSDIYSIGVLLYRLVTGSYPVEARCLCDMREAHTRGELIPLRERRADLPEAFLKTVDLALSPDFGERFALVGQMFQALHESLNLEVVKDKQI